MVSSGRTFFVGELAPARRGLQKYCAGSKVLGFRVKGLGV